MRKGRSTFVTVVSWIFIVLSGFATLVAATQNVLFWTVFPVEQFRQAPSSGSAVLDFFVRNPRVIVGAFLLMCLLLLTASIGLLNRREWARLVFIGVLTLSIGWLAFSLIIQWVVFSEMPVDQDPSFATAVTLIRTFSVVFTATLCTLFGWIIKRLVSSSVKHEFANPFAIE